MKKSKLKLKDLEVKSFATTLAKTPEDMSKAKGGTGTISDMVDWCNSNHAMCGDSDTEIAPSPKTGGLGGPITGLLGC